MSKQHVYFFSMNTLVFVVEDYPRKYDLRINYETNQHPSKVRVMCEAYRWAYE